MKSTSQAAKKTNGGTGRTAELPRNAKIPTFSVPGSMLVSSSASGSIPADQIASNHEHVDASVSDTSLAFSMPPSGLFSAESSGNATSFASLSSFEGNQAFRADEDATGKSPANVARDAYKSQEQAQTGSNPTGKPMDPFPTPNQFGAKTIIVIPDQILGRIFSIAATTSYSSREVLPLVCRRFRSVAEGCPAMWDTFEVMTGNRGALSSRKQIEHVALKSGDEPLLIGVGISGSRMGAWNGSDHEDDVDEGGSNEVLSVATASRRVIDMLSCLLVLMPRVEELIVDVYDDELDREVEQSLFTLLKDNNSPKLKHLTLLGGVTIDRIFRQWRSLSSEPFNLPPSFPSLRHISLGYSALSPISHPMPDVISLKLTFMDVKPVGPSSGYFPAHVLLLNFPGLVELEIVGNISKAEPIQSNKAKSKDSSELHSDQTPQPPPLIMTQLKRLTLNGLELTSPILSSLRIPHVHTLVLKDFDLGFDPREVQFETKVAFPDPSLYSAVTPTKGQGYSFSVPRQQPAPYALRPLPFGTFLIENAYWWSLRSLTLERLPEMVVRMCTDFVKVVGGIPWVMDGGNITSGVTKEKAEQVEGLIELKLVEFRWPDWAHIFPPTTFYQYPSEPHTPKIGGHGQNQKKEDQKQPNRVYLPYIRRLTVKLDHIPNYSSRHGNSNSGGSSSHSNKYAQEIEKERDEWMKGLLLFAEQRVSRRAVIKMLREWKMEVPAWILDKQLMTSLSASVEQPKSEQEVGDVVTEKISSDVVRTLDEISLVTGYTDTFAFIHEAWLAMQRQREQ